MYKKITLLLSLIVLFNLQGKAQLSANFGSSESAVTVYNNGFDNATDFAKWTTTTTNSAFTWEIVNKPRITGIPAFSSINPTSTGSLACFYDDSAYAAQDETITSPKTLIPAASKCSFYACFDGVFIMYANVKLYVIDGDTEEKIFDFFLWSQDNGHERPKWIPFSVDLSKYANKEVSFKLEYKGRGGDDFLLDDFSIKAADVSDEAKVEINEAVSDDYINASKGATSYEWEF